MKNSLVHRSILGLLVLVLAACTPPSVAVVMPEASPQPTAALKVPTATQPPRSTPTPPLPSPTPLRLPDEAIAILQPGPGSVVTSPLTIAGVADPTFEQTLVIRLVTEDGTELVQQTATIEAEAGERGAFKSELYFVVWTERNAFVQVYHQSPRDGAIVHLASAALRLSPTGPADLVLSDLQAERIHILTPAAGDAIRGGQVQVEGIGVAGFEQTLLVEVYDSTGNRIGGEPVLLQGVGLGEPGPFKVAVRYQAAEAGPGRIVVRDISPAYGGDVHLASVEVELSP